MERWKANTDKYLKEKNKTKVDENDGRESPTLFFPEIKKHKKDPSCIQKNDDIDLTTFDEVYFPRTLNERMSSEFFKKMYPATSFTYNHPKDCDEVQIKTYNDIKCFTYDNFIKLQQNDGEIHEPTDEEQVAMNMYKSLGKDAKTYFNTSEYNFNKILNPTYWYSCHDVDKILRCKFMDNSHVHLYYAFGLSDNEIVTYRNSKKKSGDFTEKMKKFATKHDDKTYKILPINIGSSHWTLMIFSKINGKIDATFFDPFGQRCPEILSDTLIREVRISHFDDVELKVQKDGYNCGPWIIEAAVKFVDTNGINFDRDFSIERKRIEHINCLRRINF